MAPGIGDLLSISSDALAPTPAGAATNRLLAARIRSNSAV
jgi:hypothetical protein